MEGFGAGAGPCKATWSDQSDSEEFYFLQVSVGSDTGSVVGGSLIAQQLGRPSS